MNKRAEHKQKSNECLNTHMNGHLKQIECFNLNRNMI